MMKLHKLFWTLPLIFLFSLFNVYPYAAENTGGKCVLEDSFINGGNSCANWTENDPSGFVKCDDGGIYINDPSATTANIKFDRPLYPNDEPWKYNWSMHLWANVSRNTHFGIVFNYHTENSSVVNPSFQPRYYLVNKTTNPTMFLATPQGNAPRCSFSGTGWSGFTGTHYNKISIYFYTNNSVACFINDTQVGFEEDAKMGQTDSSRNKNVSWLLLNERDGNANTPVEWGLRNFTLYNESCTIPIIDTTPPRITYYNLTNENGCDSWTSDTSTPCITSSVSPTVQFNTSENAWCAIAGGISDTSFNINYTQMTSLRNCTGEAAGEGTQFHRCTLVPEDELVYDTSYLFISCKDASNNMNRSGASTSGPLKVSVNGLEAAGRTSIGIGIQNALLSGYINYTDVPIYARSLNNNQTFGTFDKAAEKSSRTWGFNWIGASESHVRMPNLTNVLYTLELANKTSINLTLEVEKLINLTK